MANDENDQNNPLIEALTATDQESAFQRAHGMSTGEWVKREGRKTGKFNKAKVTAKKMACDAWENEISQDVERASDFVRSLEIRRKIQD